MKKFVIIGFVLTIFYILFWIIFEKVSVMEKWPKMDLNARGDFLAGLFAPLAFLWLVIGFFQQSEELRNSVEALRIQARELKTSNDNQSEIIDLTTKEIKQQIAIRQEENEINYLRNRPHFYLAGDASWPAESLEIEISIINANEDGYIVICLMKQDNEILANFPVWRNGEIKKISVPCKLIKDSVDNYLRIRFLTRIGSQGNYYMSLKFDNGRIFAGIGKHQMQ